MRLSSLLIPISLSLSFLLVACGSSGGDATDGTHDSGDASVDTFDSPSHAETEPFEETGSVPIDTGPPPTLTVTFDDEDRRSNVGFGDPGMQIVQPKTAAHPVAIVTDTLPHVHLRTWPELTEVSGAASAGATTEEPTTFPAGTEFKTRVTFHPAAALGDRWYLLSFLGAPSDWEVRAPAQPGGELGMRFRPGSDPNVRSLYVESSSPTAGKVYVYFTEHVTASADPMTIVTLTQPGADTKCAPMATPIYDDTIGMLCVIDPALSLEVKIGAGVTGEVAPHLPVAPLTLDFDKSYEANAYLLP